MGLSFQPSDFVKYVLIVNLSFLLAQKKQYIKSLYYSYVPMLCYIMIVVILIALQPNLSTAFLILSTSLVLLFIGGAQIKHIVFTVLAILPVAVLYTISKAYALKRIIGFSEHTTSGDSDYQLSQALIGFGNGGVFGVGPGNSSQKELFLPQSYDDFIFSIIGEEYGFIGVIMVILMFGIFIFRSMRLSQTINDDFGKYLAFGITSIIGLQTSINMLVAAGMIPTTGVTLPFISYGGSSLILNSIAVGILLNISTHRSKPAGSVWDDLKKVDDE
jgi:cell division protein FtsW